MNIIPAFFILMASVPLMAGDINPKSYTIEQFINASDRELRAHKSKLEALEKQGKLTITPSQAQLFYPDPVANRDELESRLRQYSTLQDKGVSRYLPPPKKSWIDPRWWGGNVAHTVLSPDKIEALNQAMKKDVEVHEKGGATVYHSTNPRAYGEAYIRTKGEELIRELQGAPVRPSKWLMLRDPVSGSIDKEKAVRKEYLSTGVKANEFGITTDEEPEVAARLMSCSIGLASSEMSESSLYWLLKQKERSLTLLKPIEFSGQYGPEVTSLAQEMNKEVDALSNSVKTGILLQMAVKDRNILNKIMYSSLAFGGKASYPVGDKESKRTVEAPKEFIETWMKRPSDLSFRQSPQTRVVLTADKMLDPGNPKVRENVEFNAYADNQKAIHEFQAKVDAAFDKQRVMSDYKARYSRMSLPQKFWHNLQYKACKSPLLDAYRKVQRDSPY